MYFAKPSEQPSQKPSEKPSEEPSKPLVRNASERRSSASALATHSVTVSSNL